MAILSHRLKIQRAQKGVSQKQVAEILGISERNYRRYENENIDPLSSNIVKLADYFEVTTDYLLGRTDEPN